MKGASNALTATIDIAARADHTGAIAIGFGNFTNPALTMKGGNAVIGWIVSAQRSTSSPFIYPTTPNIIITDLIDCLATESNQSK
jgi:hypothetical protein